jgi:hypothetical protein
MKRNVYLSAITAAVLVIAGIMASCQTEAEETDPKAAFLAFAEAVNGGNTSLNFTLEADIDLSDIKPFTPIGSKDAPFIGVFDGNGHIITGLDIRGDSFTALFAMNGGTIRNFTAAGTVTARGQDLTDYAAGIVAYNSYNGVIEDVTANITVNASGRYNVGGIAGFNGCDVINPASPYYSPDESYEARAAAYKSGGLITRCLNTGPITGYSKTGGIVGENAGTVSQCANTSSIVSLKTGASSAGGIAGRNGDNWQPIETGLIDSCYNTGKVGSPTRWWIGGITGWRNDFSVVSNCYTAGELLGERQCNPIVGEQDSRSGNSTGTSGSTGREKSAGCLNNYSIEGLPHSGDDPFETGIILTHTAMTDPSFPARLGSAFAADIRGINGGYPVLAWQIKE